MSAPANNTSQDDGDSESVYHLKWIPWNNGMIPIVMQSINGPCPLIATINVLLLREKIKFPRMLEQITATQLLGYLGECIMDSVPMSDVANDENALLNLEQNIHDAMEILPKLKTGLDVNIRFTGITDFEYTPECIIFDLLRIPLYHGWLSDPSLLELQNAIGNQSYNQLVDNIITNKSSQDPIVATKVLIAEEFLDKTASQLTLYGLQELKSRIKDNEIGILFRNNHFLTLFKRDSEIYTLVTDHGYLTEDNIIWETLDNLEGAGRFFDADFQVAETTNRQVSELNAIDQRQQQMENDFLMALSLKEEYAREEEGQTSEDPGGATRIVITAAEEPNTEINNQLDEEKQQLEQEQHQLHQHQEQQLQELQQQQFEQQQQQQLLQQQQQQQLQQQQEQQRLQQQHHQHPNPQEDTIKTVATDTNSHVDPSASSAGRAGEKCDDDQVAEVSSSTSGRRRSRRNGSRPGTTTDTCRFF